MTRAPDPALATLYRLGGAPDVALRRLRAPEEALARFAPDLAALDLCREDAAAALLAWPAVATQIQPAIDRLGLGVRSLPEAPAAGASHRSAPTEPRRTRGPGSLHSAPSETDRRRVVDLLETHAVGRPGGAAHPVQATHRASAERGRSAPTGERPNTLDRGVARGDVPSGRKPPGAATAAEARRRLRRAAEHSGAPEAADRVVRVMRAEGAPERTRRAAPATADAAITLHSPVPDAPAAPASRPGSRSPLAAGDPVVARLAAALGALEANRARRRPAQSGPNDPPTHRTEVGDRALEAQGPAPAALTPAPSDRPRASGAPSIGLRGLAERATAPARRLEEPAPPRTDSATPIAPPTRETLTRHIADILRHEARRHGIDVDEGGP